MAQTSTTISAAVTASDLIIPVTAATGFTVGNFLKIDNEYMVVTAISGTNITVRIRGDLGSGAVAHNILALATTGLMSDLADMPLGQETQVDPKAKTIVTYSAAGAIAIPTQDTVVVLNGASARAMTLAGPAVDQDGLTVTILNATAVANTVTYTAGFYGDTTASDVATFATKVGGSMTIIARGGTWGVVALANVSLG
jgi:hypothetical protein|tara:strand:- start:2544 stop:3137 length:594 start_codon:yes stop_codon:yes gene_type:complete